MRKFMYGLFGLTVLGITWLVYKNLDVSQLWPTENPAAEQPAETTATLPPVAATTPAPPTAKPVTPKISWKIDAQLPALKKTGHALLLRQNRPEWLGNVPGDALRAEFTGEVILEELHFTANQTFGSVLEELKKALAAQNLTLKPGAFGAQSWYFLVDGHAVNLAPAPGGVLAIAFPAAEFAGWQPFLAELFAE